MHTVARPSKRINLKNQAISMKYRKNNAQGFINPRIKQLSIVCHWPWRVAHLAWRLRLSMSQRRHSVEEAGVADDIKAGSVQ